MFLFLSGTITSYSQYFGRNKPSYRLFDFKVYQTPNFELYNYLDNDSILKAFAIRSELWCRHHQKIFRDTIPQRNPIILYENHAEFQQTTAVSGLIGESTGGVTEAFKQRVVMPLFSSFAQTDHVLGHELVHAFQYNMLINDDSLNLMSTRNIPLWMIEGMAEYFSIGSIDPHTAMWMRDAVLSKDIPTLKDMTGSYKYFPYRYGQAVIAMIGKTWGDSIIVPLFKQTAIYGYEKAFKNKLGMDAKSFSSLWKEFLKNSFMPVITDTLDNLTGRKVLLDRNVGKMNLSPSISPDGKYVVFLSERDVFSLDLFLADTQKGKIIRKLSSWINNNEIDALSFLESSGSWSPDGKDFAFVAISEGKNKLIIMNVEHRKKIQEIELPGLPSINNPSWSPDGKTIALSAMRNGVSDIFLYDIETGKVTQLTNDSYANLQPSWSADGKYIAYVTDRPLPGQQQAFHQNFYNIAIKDVNDPPAEKMIELFTGAKNMNPLFSNDGKSLFFLSDRDGFRNLYRYNFEGDSIWQMTKYMRGITGITAHSPAISIAREKGDIVYSYFSEKSYTLYSARQDEFKEFPVAGNEIDYTAATLPPLEHKAQNIIDSSLQSQFTTSDIHVDEFKSVPYRPKFKLDYISNATIGISTSRLGTGMAGSINALFGDMTGDNQIFASLALNGEIYDFGGMVAYINQKRRLKWGGILSHIPNYYGYLTTGIDTLTMDSIPFLVGRVDLNYIRMFEDKVSLFTYYPISQTRRFEFSGEMAHYSYRYDQYITYYDLYGTPIGTDRRKLKAPKGFNLQKIDVAYVLDNSTFGITGPVNGTRYRLEVGKYFGALNYYAILADFRKYYNVRPYTLAFRSYNAGRWGSGSENEMLTPLYIGYPWLIRGYQRLDPYWSDVQLSGNRIGIDNFFGSKIFVANAECRLPFTGPENISLIKSELFFTDFILFFDSGLALIKGSEVAKIKDWLSPQPGERVPVFSYGASIRLNLFGYMVLEPFYAVPIRKGNRLFDGNFGLNFTPGW